MRDHDPVLRRRRWSGPAVRLLRRVGVKQVPVHVTTRQTSVRRRTGLSLVASVYWSTSQLACIIIIHTFITRASSVMILNQRRWQSLGGQHGKGVDKLLEKVSFQTAFEGVESG